MALYKYSSFPFLFFFFPFKSPNPLVRAFVTSCLNYFNAILDRLQRVRNAAGHIVTDTRKYDHGLSTMAGCSSASSVQTLCISSPVSAVQNSTVHHEVWSFGLHTIVWRCLRDPMFSLLVQCRLVTDRRTDGHTTTAYIALA